MLGKKGLFLIVFTPFSSNFCRDICSLNEPEATIRVVVLSSLQLGEKGSAWSESLFKTNNRKMLIYSIFFSSYQLIAAKQKDVANLVSCNE